MPKSNAPGMSAEKIADIPVDQAPVIASDQTEREPVVVKAEKMPPKQWLEDMKFMDEPVTIRIEPSSEKNAPQWVASSVNGDWAEIQRPDGSWQIQMEGFLPIGIRITTKRKYLENLIRSKIDIINVEGTDGHAVDMGMANRIRRSTSAVHGITIINDPSPARGQQWVEECRRRYF